jgi:hypothetical protein
MPAMNTPTVCIHNPAGSILSIVFCLTSLNLDFTRKSRRQIRWTEEGTGSGRRGSEEGMLRGWIGEYFRQCGVQVILVLRALFSIISQRLLRPVAKLFWPYDDGSSDWQQPLDRRAF